MSVAELLDRARRRALEIENDLDEALGEILTLEGMVERFTAESGQ